MALNLRPLPDQHAPLPAPPLRRLLAPPTAPARGSGRRGVKRIVVALDEAFFDQIAALAALSRVSMAEAVRQLLERAMAADAPTRRRRR